MERRLRNLELRAAAAEQHEAWTAFPVGPTDAISSVWPFNRALDALTPVLVPLPLHGLLRARRLHTRLYRTTADDARVAFAVYRADDAGRPVARTPPTAQESTTRVVDYAKGDLELVANLGGADAVTGNIESSFRETTLDPAQALYLIAMACSDANTNMHAPDNNNTGTAGWVGEPLGADMVWPKRLRLTSGAFGRPAIGLYSARAIMAWGG